MIEQYITGNIDSSIGKINLISTQLSKKDILSNIKVRWSFGRMDYSVAPGLYAVGIPDADSDVFVSCNFKLSFDHLRRALHGLNGWILVLDTKGINVWCAAGKGTFGTKELAFRIKEHQLEKLINHKKIIVPQLGATGVSACKIKEETGFKVIYGPVRAGDIKNFITNKYKATPEMRKVNFDFWERMKLIPIELFYGKYFLIIVPLLFFIIAGFNVNGFSVDNSWKNGGIGILNLYVAYLSGCVLTPLLLPFIPFKRFSLKGLITGWLMAFILLHFDFLGNSILEIFSWFLIIGGLSSFMAMNFTGSSTFTSLSGVQKEVKLSLPLQIVAASLGLIGWIVTRFI